MRRNKVETTGCYCPGDAIVHRFTSIKALVLACFKSFFFFFFHAKMPRNT